MDKLDTDNYLQNGLDDISKKEQLPDEGENSLEKEETEDLNYARKSNKERGGVKNILKGKSLKKFGPVGLVVAILAIVTTGFSVTMTPSIAINHFTETLNNTFNFQETFVPDRIKEMVWLQVGRKAAASVTKRASKLVYREASMLEPSEALVKRFQDAGVEIRDGTMKFNGETLKQADFQYRYYQDRNFRNKIDYAGRGRLGRMTDSVVDNIKKTVKITGLKLKTFLNKKKNSIAETADDALDDVISAKTGLELEDPKTKYGDGIDLLDKDNDADAAGNAAKRLQETQNGVEPATTGKPKARKVQVAANIFPKLIKSIDILSNISDATVSYCNLFNTVVIANSIAKMEITQQLMRYANVFLQAGDSIKAGDASEELISYIGDILMAMVPTTLPSGETSISTALDSTGFIYASQGVLDGNINASENPAVTKYQNATTGTVANLMATLKNNSLNTKVCGTIKVSGKEISAWTTGITIAIAVVAFVVTVVATQGTGVTLGTAISSTILSTIIAAAPKVAVGVGISYAIDEFAKYLSDIYSSAIAGISVSSDTKGGEAGEAAMSGSSALFSRISRDSGGGILSKDAALKAGAYRRHLVAQRAEDERAEKSPFDVSSPYTFLGSIIYKAWPYRSKAATAMGKIKSLFSFAQTSINSLLPSSEAMAYASDSRAFDQCPDPDYQSLQTETGHSAAFDIYCNPVHGIPIGALFDRSGAELAGIIDLPGILTADMSGSNRSEGFVGQYFTPDIVNVFLDKLTFEKDGEVEYAINETCGIVNDDANPLFKYYKNCVNRNNTPYGSIYEGEKGEETENNFSKTFAGDDGTLSNGSDCILTNEPLLNSSAKSKKPQDIIPDDYTLNGQRVMFALLFTDERAVNILSSSGTTTNDASADDSKPEAIMDIATLEANYTTAKDIGHIRAFVDAVKEKDISQLANKDYCYMEGSPHTHIHGAPEGCFPYTNRCLFFALYHSMMLGKSSDEFASMTPSKGATGGSGFQGNFQVPTTTGLVDDPSKKNILVHLYQNLSIGNTCIIKVGKTDIQDSSGSRHYVTVIGYKKHVQSAEQLRESDLVTIDSWDGKIKRLGVPGARYMFYQHHETKPFNFWEINCSSEAGTVDKPDPGAYTGSGGNTGSRTEISLGVCPPESSDSGGGGGGGDGYSIVEGSEVEEYRDGSGDFAILIPKNPPSKTSNPRVWLAGSGETGFAALDSGLPKYAKEHGSNVPVIIPTKSGSYWGESKTAAAVKKALDILKEKGYTATKLSGWGFSAGGQGIARLATSNMLPFSDIIIMSIGTRGKASSLADLAEATSMKTTFIAGTEDSYHALAKEDYNTMAAKTKLVEFHEVPGVGHDANKITAAAISLIDGFGGVNTPGGSGNIDWKPRGCDPEAVYDASCMQFKDRNGDLKHFIYPRRSKAKPKISLKKGESVLIKVFVPTSAGDIGCVRKIARNNREPTHYEHNTTYYINDLKKTKDGDSDRCDQKSGEDNQKSGPLRPVVIDWSVKGTRTGTEEGGLTISFFLTNYGPLGNAVDGTEFKSMPQIDFTVL